jgi:hypothetical protein
MWIATRGAGEGHARMGIKRPRRQRGAASILLRSIGIICDIRGTHRLVVAKRHPHHQADDRKLDQSKQHEQHPQRHCSIDATTARLGIGGYDGVGCVRCEQR